MVNSSQKSKCDTAQLLDVIHHPHEKERTLGVLTTFISNKGYVGAARKLDEGDVVKLVDVIDQVCRIRLKRTLLTTTSVIRPSEPTIGTTLESCHCYGHWARYVVPPRYFRTRRFYPMGWLNLAKSLLPLEGSPIRGGGSSKRYQFPSKLFGHTPPRTSKKSKRQGARFVQT
jgi:hypothetical protein